MWHRIKGSYGDTYVASRWAPLPKASIHLSKIFNNRKTVDQVKNRIVCQIELLCS